MAQAKKDQNRVSTLLGVSSSDGETPVDIWANPTTHALFVENLSGVGTVTTVSVVTANGISGTVANPTTTPAITLSLGDITPSKVNGNIITTGTGTLTLSSFTLTMTGNASVQGTNTGDQNLSGLVPYTGATGDVTLGVFKLTAQNVDVTQNELYTGIADPSAPASGFVKLYAQTGVDGLARLTTLSSAGFALTIHRDMVQRVYNNTVGSMTKGQAVYVTGTSGGVPTVALSKADALSTADVTGILIADAAPSSFTTMQREGLVQNIDTSGFNVGDSLWLSSSVAGAFQTTAPAKPNIIVPIGVIITKNALTGSVFIDIVNNPPVSLASLTDVSLTSPAVDQFLRYNGTNWVNGAGATSGVGPGIDFFSATPVIVSRTSPAGISQDGTAGNGIQINTLSKTPVTTTEQTQSGLASTDTRAYAAWKYDTALGRTSIDAGIWTFQVYAAVNSATGTNTITRGIYQVVPVSSGSVTFSGPGANSRTATITSAQFTGTYFAPSATNTTASYIEITSGTETGLYQITASGTTNTATVTVPTGFSNANATAVSFNIWNKLFSQTSSDITATGTNYTLQTFTTAQPAFTIAATDKFGSMSFFTSTVASKTVTTTYNGLNRNSFFTTPLITLHNNLAGLQGGTANEFYHLTSAEYTGSGTGIFARVSSPIFTTPNIGSATGSISGNAGTVTNATLTTALTVNGGSLTLTANVAGSTLTLAAGANTIPVKAAGTDLDTGTDDAKFATAKAINDSHNVPSVAPGTSGNVMTSDGTDWTSSAATGGGSFSISLADHAFSGITSTLTAGENLAITDVCYRKSDGKMWKADASAIATSSAIAIALGTINADATGSFGMIGYFRDDSAYNWTVGGLLYLSETAGAIVQTAPVTTASVTQVLGVAMTADIIYFNPSLVQVEHA